jgi:hypothetical protein
MNTVKLVAVFAENRPGQAARIAAVMAKEKINIRCLTVSSSGAYGVMKLLVNDPDRAYRALNAAGFASTLIDVIAVELADQPGALYSVADCLARNDVNLSNTSGFVANNHGILVLEVENPGQGVDVLQQHGFHVLTQEETLAN